jgi:hypothetical protein
MKNVENKRIDGCDVPCATAVLTPCVKKKYSGSNRGIVMLAWKYFSLTVLNLDT